MAFYMVFCFSHLLGYAPHIEGLHPHLAVQVKSFPLMLPTFLHSMDPQVHELFFTASLAQDVSHGARSDFANCNRVSNSCSIPQNEEC